MDAFKLLKGGFCEGETITINIDGNQINRKVRYRKDVGLYIVYKNRMYFEYECDESKIYKQQL